MKKRKFAAGGYLPNYGDEQNPFTPTIINPEGQDMSLPAMGNPDDPYQGYRHGGKVKMKTKKMAMGGMGAGQQRRAAEDPSFARQQANMAAYTGVQQGRKQFAIGSPERQNYGAFQKMEQDKYRAASGRGGAPVGTYTAGKYNPATSYTTQLTQQKTAADAAKKAAMPVKMANGGMATGGALNISPSRRKLAAQNPAYVKGRENQASFKKVAEGINQFEVDTPERQNYDAFRKMEYDKYRATKGRLGTAVGTYTAGTYNPNTSYATQLAQAPAFKRTESQKTPVQFRKDPAPKGYAKGGMASSASKRGDGCAMRGKTKGKMY